VFSDTSTVSHAHTAENVFHVLLFSFLSVCKSYLVISNVATMLSVSLIYLASYEMNYNEQGCTIFSGRLPLARPHELSMILCLCNQNSLSESYFLKCPLYLPTCG
jgi:hypothetical protein